MGLEWTDQPKVLAGLPVRMKAFVNAHLVEVREGTHDVWYVTSGNLFGSQTIMCYTARVAFEVIDLINAYKDGQLLSLPLGAEVIPNEE